MIEINYGLFSNEDFDLLPEDPQGKFVVFESVSRKNLVKEINTNPPEKAHNFKTQYISTVAAAADELGVQGLYNITSAPNPDVGFDRFINSVNSIITKLRLRGVTLKSSTSVSVPSGIHDKIRNQVAVLKEIIEKSDFPQERKNSLYEKLDQLIIETSQQRTNFGKVMSIIAFVSMAVHGTTGFLADAPEAIATITSLIGTSKEVENGESLRIEGPITPKALPAPGGQAT